MSVISSTNADRFNQVFFEIAAWDLESGALAANAPLELMEMINGEFDHVALTFGDNHVELPPVAVRIADHGYGVWEIVETGENYHNHGELIQAAYHRALGNFAG